MNKQIKDILEKHVDLKFIGNGTFAENLNNAIIDICSRQIEVTAKQLSKYLKKVELTYKNISK